MKKVLVAEDNEMNQKLMMVTLRRFGLPVDVADNGLKAVELYKSDPGSYLVIIMDIHMPVMDGLEATREIRRFEKDPGLHVPIIALTANAFATDVDNFMISGMDDYLVKPLGVELLKESFLKLGITV